MKILSSFMWRLVDMSLPVTSEQPMKRYVTVLRDTWGYKQSTGVTLVQDETGKILFTSQSLERGSRGNQRRVSCIPAGTYPLKLEYSNKFKRKLWEIKNVPNRTECKFHSANFWDDLNGCISNGLTQRDINGDGLVDNISSKAAMREFKKAMGNASHAELRVINNIFQ